ncbi:MAG: hypothetical protein P8P74_12285 [Crocinitomicaceae bacterium]|nr:hypothetical protein [Crocinitomicaceae bacterium]
MNSYYTPSGKFSPLSFILFAVLALVVFPVLGGLYTYAIWYIPLIYINFLITGAFAILLGILIKFFVIRFGKVRNTKLGIAFGVIGGTLAIYAHWVVWADLMINSEEVIGNGRMGVLSSSTNFEELLIIAQNPKLLFELMSEVSSFGTWSIFGFMVSGVLLWIIWIIEAIVIYIGAIIIGIPDTKVPFCEKSNAWFKETELTPMSFIFSKPDLVNELELGQTKILSTLTLHDVVRDNTSYSQFTIYSSDHDENYLTVVNKKKMIDSKGEVNYEDDEVIEYIEISSQTLKILENVPKRERNNTKAEKETAEE